MKTLIIILLSMLLTVNAVGIIATGGDFNTADLPPDGVYLAPGLSFTYEHPGGAITLSKLALTPLVDIVEREAVGNDEVQTFNARLKAILGTAAITLTGPVQTRVTNRNLSTAGLFDAEIVSMSLSGNVPGVGPISIRESSTQASTGKTDILDIGGGLYHIDSFFDVFTELSVDGGQSWIASTGSVRMELFPEPASICLLALGGLLMRRKK